MTNWLGWIIVGGLIWGFARRPGNGMGNRVVSRGRLGQAALRQAAMGAPLEKELGQGFTITVQVTYSTTRGGVAVNWNYKLIWTARESGGAIADGNTILLTNKPATTDFPLSDLVAGGNLLAGKTYNVSFSLMAADPLADGTPGATFKLLASKLESGLFSVKDNTVVSAGALGLVSVSRGSFAAVMRGRR